MRGAVALALAVGVPLTGLAPGCGGASHAPNAVLITVDTLRADHLGAYGFPLETSPNIDRLAASGALFERAIAASSTTSPSHASILTSRYPREHSVGYETGTTRLVGLATLAERFGAAGYATAAFVGNVSLRRQLGFGRGFELYDDELPAREANRPLHAERIAEDTTRRALAWLAAPRERPFFLWVHYQDPHGPYAPPPEHAGRFRLPPAPGEAPLPVLDDNHGSDGIPRYQALEGLFLPSEYRGRYADEIFYADRSIGALLAAVDAAGAGRDAVVLLTADHGESLGEEGAWFMHHLGSTPQHAHVPMILRAPGLAPTRRAEAVSHVDVMPTLLELAGLEVPPGVRGIALGPYLRDGRPLPERFVYCDTGVELSAYQRDFFVRIQGLENAYLPGAAVSPTWGAHRWSDDGAWEQTGDVADAEARLGRHAERIVQYYLRPVPMVRAPAPGADTLERLRALGYAD